MKKMHSKLSVPVSVVWQRRQRRAVVALPLELHGGHVLLVLAALRGLAAARQHADADLAVAAAVLKAVVESLIVCF